ncbi:DoxX family protein [soil metagenome]
MTPNNFSSKWRSCAPYLKSILRIVSGYIFIQSGTMKIFSFPVGMPPEAGTLNLTSQIGIGGILEVLGGLLIILGLFTRVTSFILSGEMAVAYFQFHAPTGFWTLTNGGGDAMLFCFIFLYFSAAGGGPWSLDALRGSIKSSFRTSSDEEKEQPEKYK